MKTWKEIRKQLGIKKEEEIQISFEKELINQIIAIRESEGLSQSELAN